MNDTITIKGVVITLTKQQIEKIEKGRVITKVEEIDGIEDAERVLANCENHEKFVESQFVRAKDWNNYKIETIIKAANFLDNKDKEWNPDFDNTNQNKYYPYFKKERNGWVLGSVDCFHYCSGSVMGSGFYFKKESSAELIGRKFLGLYSQYLDN